MKTTFDGKCVNDYLQFVMKVADYLDPRIKRTRQALVDAFTALLLTKNFDVISVNDIATQAGVNRATFYDHFADKYALLDHLVDDKFRAFLEARTEKPAALCRGALKRLILAVCDYLTELNLRCPERARQLEPLAGARIKTLVRSTLLKGLAESSHAPKPAHPELAATVASWAIYGAALEWSAGKIESAEVFADAVLPMIDASLQISTPAPAER